MIDILTHFAAFVAGGVLINRAPWAYGVIQTWLVRARDAIRPPPR